MAISPTTWGIVSFSHAILLKSSFTVQPQKPLLLYSHMEKVSLDIPYATVNERRKKKKEGRISPILKKGSMTLLFDAWVWAARLHMRVSERWPPRLPVDCILKPLCQSTGILPVMPSAPCRPSVILVSVMRANRHNSLPYQHHHMTFLWLCLLSPHQRFNFMFRK